MLPPARGRNSAEGQGMSGILSNLLDDVKNLPRRSIRESRAIRVQGEMDDIRAATNADLAAKGLPPLPADAPLRTDGSLAQRMGIKTLAERMGGAPGQSLAQQ